MGNPGHRSVPLVAVGLAQFGKLEQPAANHRLVAPGPLLPVTGVGRRAFVGQPDDGHVLKEDLE